MDITGYRLLAKLRELMNRRDALYVRFEDVYEVFPFEIGVKAKPQTIGAELESLESRIALLQTLQLQYNLSVQVPWRGTTRSLESLIKAVGGIGRLSKLYRKRAIGGAKDRYAYREDTIKEGETRKEAQMSQDDALGEMTRYETIASELREAIQIGNATVINALELMEPSAIGFIFS